MTERPHFPPIYNARAVNMEIDPFGRAADMAGRSAEAGTLLWSVRQDVYECAVILAPESSFENTMAIPLVTSLGLGDALGALIPPVVAVTFGWPNRIELNGALVGHIRTIIAETPNPTAVPEWLVVGFSLANVGHWQEGEGGGGHRTTLIEEGCQIDLIDLLESFSRHFLSWVNRWMGDGVEPVQQAWMSRTLEVGKPISIDIGGKTREGIFKGLDEQCGLELVDQGRHYVVPLGGAIEMHKSL